MAPVCPVPARDCVEGPHDPAFHLKGKAEKLKRANKFRGICEFVECFLSESISFAKRGPCVPQNIRTESGKMFTESHDFSNLSLRQRN